MRLGVVDVSRGQSACFLCGQVYQGSEIKADLVEHIRASHHRVMLTAEPHGKEPEVGQQDSRVVVIYGPRWFNDIAG